MDFDLVCIARTADEFWKKITNLTVDIVLCGLDLSTVSGIQLTWKLKQKRPKIKVVIYADSDDNGKIFEALQAGASGFLLKDMKLPNIKRELLAVMDGGAALSPKVALKIINYFKLSEKSKQDFSELTKRESEIVYLLRQGFTNKDIAGKLFISCETVKSHIKNIYLKLHVENRAQFYNMFKKPL